MPHFCWDEIYMITMGVPFIGYGLLWLRSKLPTRKSSCPCEHESEHEHG